MTKVKIFTFTRQANEKLATTKLAVAGLQSIHDALVSLGADAVDIDDIKSVVNADSSPGVIREIILRGKSLTVGGIAIDPAFLKLPDDKIRDLARYARNVDSGRNITWPYYAVQDGTVICLECAESEIMELHTVYGSTKAANVVSEIEKLADEINRIGDLIGLTTYHPLRHPESWFYWDTVKNKFVPNIPHIAQHV